MIEDELGQRPEPTQPLLPGNGCVRGRGRGENEERGVAEAPPLEPVLGTFAERPSVRLLADERDRARLEIPCERFEAHRAAGEVTRAQVARAGSCSIGRVCDADAEREQVELLAGVDKPGSEPGGVEQAPEVVAWVRKVGVRGVREAARVDAAEDDRKPRRQYVWDGGGRRRAGGYAASGSRASRRASNASRMRSVSAEGDSDSRG